MLGRRIYWEVSLCDRVRGSVWVVISVWGYS